MQLRRSRIATVMKGSDRGYALKLSAPCDGLKPAADAVVAKARRVEDECVLARCNRPGVVEAGNELVLTCSDGDEVIGTPGDRIVTVAEGRDAAGTRGQLQWIGPRS
jgi:hypothetical protein